jgi:MFS family permease
MNRCSPRILTSLGGIVVGIGYLLASQSTNLPLLILSYGVIAGLGVGMAYGVPLAVAACWFPDCKGLAVCLRPAGLRQLTWQNNWLRRSNLALTPMLVYQWSKRKPFMVCCL